MKQIEVLSPPEEVSMANEWFELANPDHFWMQWRFNVIKSGLAEFPNLLTQEKFLEIGCGNGCFLEQCQEIGARLDGCDLNYAALEKIKNTKESIFVYNIFDRNKLMLNKYRGVFLLDVIEHIDKEDDFFKAALDHILPGGYVVINVPALNLLFSKYDVVAGHKRRYSKADVLSLFQRHKVQPLIISYWGLLLLPIAIIRKIYLRFIPQHQIIDAGFKSGAFVNAVFKLIMKVELVLFKRPIIGTSIFAIGRKNEDFDEG